jgi:dTDP-4-dehydrorhamnose reductase
VQVVDDQHGHPTFVDDLAAATLAAIAFGAAGVLYEAKRGVTTWFGLARDIAVLAGLHADGLEPFSTDKIPLRHSARPTRCSTASAPMSSFWPPLPDYHQSLPEVVAELGRTYL